MPANFTFHSAPISFPSTPLVLPAGLVDAELAAATCVAPRTADAVWSRHAPSARPSAASVRPLRVGILGCSTTAGCGALSPSRMCSQELSWGRFAHDELWTHARNAGHAVSTSVYSKNAVEASFFWDCTRALLPPNPHVVMLEVFQNMYAHHVSMNATVRAIRRAAPRAAIVFVSWLKPHQQLSPAERSVPHRQTAAMLGVDLIDVPSALRVLSKRRLGSFYARTPSGSQDHHPNRQGHELIGRLAAWCVAQRLGMAGHASLAGPAASPPTIAAAGSTSEPQAVLPVTVGVLEPRVNDEQCFNAADQMPVRLARSRASPTAAAASSPGTAKTGGGESGFMLVDDGVAKGVRKLGYASNRVGDRITIGPLNLAHSARGNGCHGTVRVRLGYLVSTHSGMGAMHLKCSTHCACRPIKSAFLRRVLPFPRLETDLRASGSPLQLADANESVSITAYTIFIAKLPNASQDGPRGCSIDVTHERAHGAPRLASAPSRVRLDSLAIMEHDGMGGPSVPCA
jgi:hypothetical protein